MVDFVSLYPSVMLQETYGFGEYIHTKVLVHNKHGMYKVIVKK